MHEKTTKSGNINMMESVENHFVLVMICLKYLYLIITPSKVSRIGGWLDIVKYVWDWYWGIVIHPPQYILQSIYIYPKISRMTPMEIAGEQMNQPISSKDLALDVFSVPSHTFWV